MHVNITRVVMHVNITRVVMHVNIMVQCALYTIHLCYCL